MTSEKCAIGFLNNAFLDKHISIFRRIVVRLVSCAQTGYFYTMTRNRLKDKLELMKFDPRGKFWNIDKFRVEKKLQKIYKNTKTKVETVFYH